MTVVTSKYERTHGKMPRGYGMWIFEAEDGTWYEELGTYTEAKKTAIKKAKADGKQYLKTMP